MASNKVMSADNQQERPRKLNPWYIVGFVEGEGTFHIAFYKDPRMKTGIKIIPEFHVNQSYLRLTTLRQIKNHFVCGYIKENHRQNVKDDTAVYVVRNREDLLTKIIPFFEKYPMLSMKNKDFMHFRKVVKMMDKGAHQKISGVRQIVKIAYQMNNDGRYRKVKMQDILTFLESAETIRQKS